MRRDGHVERRLLKGGGGGGGVRLLNGSSSNRGLFRMSVIVVVVVIEIVEAILKSLENVLKWQSLLLLLTVVVIIFLIELHVLLLLLQLLATMLKHQRVLKERIVLYGHGTKKKSVVGVYRWWWLILGRWGSIGTGVIPQTNDGRPGGTAGSWCTSNNRFC